LATVNISILFIELDNLVRVSLRSKKDIDISTIAIYYGGGGHKNASGFEMKIDNIEMFLKDLIKKIEEMELLNGKKKKNI
jgi:phosphoesterase RecJ-like protein